MSEVKEIRGLLIRTDGTMEVTTLKDDLPTFYDVLNCDCIDITTRYVGTQAFSIICDDEGLLKDPQPLPTLYDVSGRPMIVGNVFITRRNGPELASIKDSDIGLFEDHSRMVFENGKTDGRWVLLCSY